MSAHRRASSASSRVQQPAGTGAQRAGLRGQRQVHADHLVPGVDRPGGGHRGVDPAAHRRQHPHVSLLTVRALHPRLRCEPAVGNHPASCRPPGPPGPLDHRPDHAEHRPPRRPRSRCARSENRSEPRAIASVGAHRQQHVAGLRDPRRAGRAGRALDAPGVQQHQQCCRPRSPGSDRCALPGSRDGPPSTIPAPGSPLSTASGTRRAPGAPARRAAAASRSPAGGLRRPRPPGARRPARRWPARPACPERTSRSCPPPCSSGVQLDVPAEQQRADAVGAAELVPGQGQRRDPGRGEVAPAAARPPAPRRCAAGRSYSCGDLGQLADRVDRADLVVRPHHR